jgi:uncharacterized protein YndB with AHSA1/START domain
MTDQVSVSREIAAPAEQVWAMVSDVTRMGEWSPENEGAEWMGGATGPHAGAKFRGSNRNGKKKWKSVATIVTAEPGRKFSFHVSFGPFSVAEWGYAFESTPTGCRVTETWVDQRAWFFKPISGMGTGVPDRATHNRAGMEKTLERLAAVAESTAAPS